MEVLRIEGLSKHFGGLNVLDDIFLSVRQGERRAIIGPNGAGKTTLFNIISGQLPPSRGRVYFLGRDISSLPAYKRACLGLGRTFQRSNLFFNLSVLDNVLLALARTYRWQVGFWSDLRQNMGLLEKSRSLLDEWGMWSRNQSLVRELSHGEQRQLEIIVGLASEPKVILLDEPTAGLSPAETVSITQRIASLPRDLTVLIIEHDMDVVFALADRVTVLHYGRVLAEGTPGEVRKNPRVQEVYLGLGGEPSNVTLG